LKQFPAILQTIGTGGHQMWVRQHLLTPVKCPVVYFNSSIMHIPVVHEIEFEM